MQFVSLDSLDSEFNLSRARLCPRPLLVLIMPCSLAKIFSSLDSSMPQYPHFLGCFLYHSKKTLLPAFSKNLNSGKSFLLLNRDLLLLDGCQRSAFAKYGHSMLVLSGTKAKLKNKRKN